jgi:tetratricopeptide (TPR) repeat protein
MGNVLKERHESEEALTHFDRAASCFSETNDLEMQAIVLRNQGRCYRDRGEPGQAIAKLENAVASLRVLHLEVECAEVALDHARALADLGERDEAHYQARAARDFLASIGAFHRLRDANKLLDQTARNSLKTDTGLRH